SDSRHVGQEDPRGRRFARGQDRQSRRPEQGAGEEVIRPLHLLLLSLSAPIGLRLGPVIRRQWLPQRKTAPPPTRPRRGAERPATQRTDPPRRRRSATAVGAAA